MSMKDIKVYIMFVGCEKEELDSLLLLGVKRRNWTVCYCWVRKGGIGQFAIVGCEKEELDSLLLLCMNTRKP